MEVYVNRVPTGQYEYVKEGSKVSQSIHERLEQAEKLLASCREELVHTEETKKSYDHTGCVSPHVKTKLTYLMDKRYPVYELLNREHLDRAYTILRAVEHESPIIIDIEALASWGLPMVKFKAFHLVLDKCFPDFLADVRQRQGDLSGKRAAYVLRMMFSLYSSSARMQDYWVQFYYFAIADAPQGIVHSYYDMDSIYELISLIRRNKVFPQDWQPLEGIYPSLAKMTDAKRKSVVCAALAKYEDAFDKEPDKIDAFWFFLRQELQIL